MNINIHSNIFDNKDQRNFVHLDPNKGSQNKIKKNNQTPCKFSPTQPFVSGQFETRFFSFSLRLGILTHSSVKEYYFTDFRIS